MSLPKTYKQATTEWAEDDDPIPPDNSPSWRLVAVLPTEGRERVTDGGDRYWTKMVRGWWEQELFWKPE